MRMAGQSPTSDLPNVLQARASTIVEGKGALVYKGRKAQTTAVLSTHQRHLHPDQALKGDKGPGLRLKKVG